MYITKKKKISIPIPDPTKTWIAKENFQRLAVKKKHFYRPMDEPVEVT